MSERRYERRIFSIISGVVFALEQKPITSQRPECTVKSREFLSSSVFRAIACDRRRGVGMRETREEIGKREGLEKPSQANEMGSEWKNRKNSSLVSKNVFTRRAPTRKAPNSEPLEPRLKALIAPPSIYFRMINSFPLWHWAIFSSSSLPEVILNDLLLCFGAFM